ncbi:MAG: hypothetical protein P4L35_20265 [Ignavibacteriaceae bacterium]|nr:hypothetical protein [Ignavibacteriaceae bacterium]
MILQKERKNKVFASRYSNVTIFEGEFIVTLLKIFKNIDKPDYTLGPASLFYKSGGLRLHKERRRRGRDDRQLISSKIGCNSQ